MILVDRSNAEAFCVFLLFTRGLMDFQNPKPSLEPLGQCLEHGSWTFGVTTRKRDPLLRKGHLGLTVRRCFWKSTHHLGCHHLFCQAQQRGVEGTKEILLGLVDGVGLPTDSITPVFVVDLVPNRFGSDRGESSALIWHWLNVEFFLMFLLQVSRVWPGMLASAERIVGWQKPHWLALFRVCVRRGPWILPRWHHGEMDGRHHFVCASLRNCNCLILSIKGNIVKLSLGFSRFISWLRSIGIHVQKQGRQRAHAKHLTDNNRQWKSCRWRLVSWSY